RSLPCTTPPSPSEAMRTHGSVPALPAGPLPRQVGSALAPTVCLARPKPAENEQGRRRRWIPFVGSGLFLGLGALLLGVFALGGSNRSAGRPESARTAADRPSPPLNLPRRSLSEI